MTDTVAVRKIAYDTSFTVLFAIGFCHLLNDMMQALLPAIYPTLKTQFHLNFAQIGLVTLAFQCTASLFQPVVGYFADLKPMPYSLALGMVSTLAGLLVLSVAPSYPVLLIAAMMIGLGSAVFHPESSRVARMASGGRYGLAQSVFQVGGNTGQAISPLTAALLVATYGQRSIIWYAGLALLGIITLFNIGTWYKNHGLKRIKSHQAVRDSGLPKGKVVLSLTILLMLIFSKFFYLASISSYYTFYLIHSFGVSVRNAQVHLFFFLGAVAVGTLVGGPPGRQDWPKICDLVLHPGYAALHPDAALCRPVLDRHPVGGYRPDHGLGLSGHRRLCAGIAAGSGRHDFGPVLRLFLRHGRHRRGGAGRAGGCDLDRLRL